MHILTCTFFVQVRAYQLEVVKGDFAPQARNFLTLKAFSRKIRTGKLAKIFIFHSGFYYEFHSEFHYEKMLLFHSWP